MALENLTPATRPEAILNGTDMAPVTRREYFMQKAATGGGGETVVFNLVEDELTGDYSFDGGKTFSDVMEAYASGSAIKWTIMGGPVAFVNYSATGTTLEGCELYNVYDFLDELDSSTVKEITFEVYHISGLGISFASGTVTTS